MYFSKSCPLSLFNQKKLTFQYFCWKIRNFQNFQLDLGFYTMLNYLHRFGIHRWASINCIRGLCKIAIKFLKKSDIAIKGLVHMQYDLTLKFPDYKNKNKNQLRFKKCSIFVFYYIVIFKKLILWYKVRCMLWSSTGL